MTTGKTRVSNSQSQEVKTGFNLDEIIQEAEKLDIKEKKWPPI
jgi:hypothetical protein